MDFAFLLLKLPPRSSSPRYFVTTLSTHLDRDCTILSLERLRGTATVRNRRLFFIYRYHILRTVHITPSSGRPEVPGTRYYRLYGHFFRQLDQLAIDHASTADVCISSPTSTAEGGHRPQHEHVNTSGSRQLIARRCLEDVIKSQRKLL